MGVGLAELAVWAGRSLLGWWLAGRFVLGYRGRVDLLNAEAEIRLVEVATRLCLDRK